jgi:hypothetical protein
MSISIYVSPEGNDKNSGTEQAPFASLHRAQQELRSLTTSFKEGKEENIEIILTPGTHRLEETLVLDKRDSGSENFRISWKGSKVGRTVISSGFPLKGWNKLTEDPEGLSEDLHGRVWFLDLPRDSRVNNLYGPEGQIARARGGAIIPQPLLHAEDVIQTTIYGPDSPIVNQDKRVPLSHDCFAFMDGAIANAPDLSEAECVIIPRNQWTMNILPVENVDFDRNILHLKESCTYPIGIPHCAPDGSIWLENSLSVMTPGSWVFHRESSRLYYCPKGEIPEEGIEATLLTELIRLEGTDDEKGVNPLQNIHFSHIEFTGTNRFSFHGLTGKGIQHDWEMHDASSCMVRFRHVQNSSITHCSFINGGSGGVRFDLASSQNTIADCEFSHLGGCGIVLCGYGLSRKYLNRSNRVTGNHLHHLGLFYWHCTGIFIWQSGDNTIGDNYLHDLPYTAIVCSGRTIYDREGHGECSGTINWDDVEAQCGKDYVHNVWHYSGITSWAMREPLMHSRDNLIEYNRIHDVMQIMGDGNGIYVSGAGGGNVVRYNAVGPCPSPTMAEGIRCDDDQHYTILHGNLIFGIGGHATGITIKGVNRITNNIIALPFVQETRRGMLSLETGPLNGAVVKHNIFYTATAEQKFVSEIRIHGTGRKARLRDTDSNHNIYYCTSKTSLGEEWVKEQQCFGNDYDSQGCDPGFVDAERGDFSLKSDSPALASGFKPLPLDRMMEKST